jgi:hypothetical protein
MTVPQSGKDSALLDPSSSAVSVWSLLRLCLFVPVIACLCSPSPYKYRCNQLPAVIQRLVSVLFYRCVVIAHPTVIESEQFSISQSAVESLNISSKTHLRLKFSFAASCFRRLHWVTSFCDHFFLRVLHSFQKQQYGTCTMEVAAGEASYRVVE